MTRYHWIAAAAVLGVGCGASAQKLLDSGISHWDEKASRYRDGARALAAFEQACSKGSADGCNRAGVVHEGFGEGVPKDLKKAVSYYERACEMGLPRGCGNLGNMLWAGTGIDKDRKRACTLQESACPANSDSCDWVACVWRATEFDYNPDQFLKKLDAQCKNKHQLSCYRLALAYGFGVPAVPADPLRGVHYAQLYDESGGGPNALALFHERGIGVRPNPAKAEELLRAACQSGNAPSSCHQLHTIRAGNEGAAAEAALFHKRYCEEGNGFNCWQLARLIAHGYGVPKDPAAATGMLKKACDEWAFPMACSDLRTGFLESFAPIGMNGSAPPTPVATVAPTQAPPSGKSPSTSGDYMTGAPQPTTYAIVIGIERYRELPSPTGARADAEQFASMARKTLGVRPENIKLAVDDRATKGDIEKLLEWARASVPQGGKLLFFFSGHGGPDASQGTPYLIPYDGDPAYLARTAVPLVKVTEALQQSQAREAVAIVDSCFSGAGGRSVLPAGARPLVRVRDVTASAQVALLSAASGAEISGPAADSRNGLFTQVLLEGLGRARADANGDGQVSTKELFEYVRPRVQRTASQAGRTQNPSLTVGASAGDPVLAFGLASH